MIEKKKTENITCFTVEETKRLVDFYALLIVIDKRVNICDRSVTKKNNGVRTRKKAGSPDNQIKTSQQLVLFLCILIKKMSDAYD